MYGDKLFSIVSQQVSANFLFKGTSVNKIDAHSSYYDYVGDLLTRYMLLNAFEIKYLRRLLNVSLDAFRTKDSIQHETKHDYVSS